MRGTPPGEGGAPRPLPTTAWIADSFCQTELLKLDTPTLIQYTNWSTTIERLCADALVAAERWIEARIAERVSPGLRRDSSGSGSSSLVVDAAPGDGARVGRPRDGHGGGRGPGDDPPEAADPAGLSGSQSFGVRVTAPFTDDPLRPGESPIIRLLE